MIFSEFWQGWYNAPIENYSRLKDQFEIVAVFQSPAVKIEQYVGQQEIPFRVIPDPDKKLYQLYGVESSWLGFGKAWTVKIGRVFNAVIRHHFIPGSMEGEIHRIPADFMITPNNTILEACYGEDIGDHLPLQQIEDLLHNHEAKWPHSIENTASRESVVKCLLNHFTDV